MDAKKSELFKKLLSAFKLESEERLNSISSCLLELEKEKSIEKQKEIIEIIFREAHSLKGASRAVNLTDIETICQSLESVFSLIKKNTLNLIPEMFDVLHNTIDAIETLFTSPENIDVSLVIKELEELKNWKDLNYKKSEKTEKEKLPVTEELKENSNLTLKSSEKSVSPFSGNLKKEEKNKEDISSNLQENNELQEKSAEVKNLPAVEIKNLPAVEIKNISVIEIKNLPDESKLESAPVKTKASSSSETIRISVSKLDSLLLQTEELLAIKLTSKERADEIKSLSDTVSLWKKEWGKINLEFRTQSKNFDKIVQKGKKHYHLQKKLGDFFEWNEIHIKSIENKLKILTKASENDCRSFGWVVDSLMEEMKKTIMLPFSSILGNFQKMVRDISRAQNKEIELIIKGSDLEVDKRILEEIKNPLIHLLRNCIDHGIEKPEERKKRNKGRTGTVNLIISQVDSNKVLIKISDDGEGINLEKIKEIAVKNNFISSKNIDNLTDDEIISFIFQSEFSTSPIITDLSGRGLGLAIVRESVEKLGGTIAIETFAHKGTNFNIRLPLSLATFRGCLVSSSYREFIVPTLNIERVIRINKNIIKTIENKETIIIDGKTIPLVWLSDILEMPAKQNKSDFLTLLILWAAEKCIAFCVDEILTEQEVLVKSFGKQLSRVRNISGATILGSGKVIPILNVSDLIKSATKGTFRRRLEDSQEESSEEKKKTILVTDDSITSRILLKNILESADYYVRTAVDGIDAFTALREQDFDLLVSDVEMPRMNGFELTEKIRKDKKLSNLPVILVTGLSSQEDREKGIEVGANAYIVKSTFDQTNLLEVIRKII